MFSLGDNDVIMMFFVKAHDTFDDHIVWFSGTGSEDNIFSICSDKASHMLQVKQNNKSQTWNRQGKSTNLASSINCSFCFPSIGMSPAVRSMIPCTISYKFESKSKERDLSVDPAYSFCPPLSPPLSTVTNALNKACHQKCSQLSNPLSLGSLACSNPLIQGYELCLKQRTSVREWPCRSLTTIEHVRM